MSLKHLIKKCAMHSAYGRRVFFIRELYRNEKIKGRRVANKFNYVLDNIHSVRVYQGKDSADSIAMMFENLPVTVAEDGHFFYNLSGMHTWNHEYSLFGNTTVDYKLLLENSLQALMLNGTDRYAIKNNRFIQALIDYSQRVSNEIAKSKNSFKEYMAQNIRLLQNAKATSFIDALQRILFTNQILWQTKHNLNGLGQLDCILYPYYRRDLEKGILDYDCAKVLIKEFCVILHNYYDQKSNCLLGDTGQIILLGGSDKDGSYMRNELTDIFIEAIMDLHLPEPKLLLKVNKNIPDDLLKKAVSCIATGNGSPLLANDDVIIPAMISFGYEQNDAYNYGVAACWEPMVPGKTFEFNNVCSINYVEPLIKLLNKSTDYKDYSSLVQEYLENLKKYVNREMHDKASLTFNEDIVMSVFMPECREKRRDITEGVLPYNHVGFTGVGMGSAVNSLLNIKKLVFEDDIYTLENIGRALKSNFEGYTKMRQKMLHGKAKYGRDMEEVIDLTQKILDTVETCCKQNKTSLGGKFKFGLSSPSYIDAGKISGATPDGRKNAEPFSTHISCADGIAYTELLQFASRLDYSGAKFNGNVVDFMVTPTFLRKNIDKFVVFLKQSIKLGFFEMQMNVVDSETLIAAKKDPEAFPNLIVRVWGFSAYFKDLPDEYKDVLIKRAIQAEQVA